MVYETPSEWEGEDCQIYMKGPVGYVFQLHVTICDYVTVTVTEIFHSEHVEFSERCGASSSIVAIFSLTHTIYITMFANRYIKPSRLLMTFSVVHEAEKPGLDIVKLSDSVGELQW